MKQLLKSRTKMFDGMVYHDRFGNRIIMRAIFVASLILLVSNASAEIFTGHEILFFSKAECKILKVRSSVPINNVTLMIYGYPYPQDINTAWLFSVTPERLDHLDLVQKEIVVCFDDPEIDTDFKLSADLIISSRDYEKIIPVISTQSQKNKEYFDLIIVSLLILVIFVMILD